MNLKTFALGGVHPPENKIAQNSAIESIDIPSKITIPVSMHLGAPAEPVVKKGDNVKAGTLIAKASSFISANIHSSVSGKVLKIDKVLTASGYKADAIVIKVEGDEWEDFIDRSSDIVRETSLNKDQLIEKIKENGIVGLGGAAFPTHVKYMVPEDKKVDTLIINAVECEPYLTADYRVMMERPDELLIGTEILKKTLGVNRAVIGIENNKPEAIKKLGKKVSEYEGIEIEPLKIKYPQGAEKQLIKAVVNREVPSGKLPLEVGCVVNNVGTAVAVYEAVIKNKPLFERVVTVTGKKLEKPSNFLTRVGIPASDLIKKAGGMPDNTGKLISGGPMMGKAVADENIPIEKATSGLLLLDESESRRKKIFNCIRCGKCISVCPMGIEPYLVEKHSESEQWEECESLDVMDCIECGSCSYTCPSSRPLLDNIRLAKGNVNKIRRERSKK